MDDVIWDQITLVTEPDLPIDDPPFEDILISYVFILDDVKRVVLQYKKEWTLPSCSIRHVDGFDKIKLLVNKIYQDSGMYIKITRLIGLQSYRQTVGRWWFKSTITKYATYYLAEIVIEDPPNYCFDPYPIFAHISFSRLTEMPIYRQYRKLFDLIYNQFKIQLILDIDRTLLVNHEIDDHAEGPDLFKSGRHPDYIMDRSRYIWTRPNLHQFMSQVSNLTELSYWTASSADFQRQVIEITHLDQYTNTVHYYNDCLVSQDLVYKSLVDLRQKYPNYDLNRTLLIDDYPLNQQANPHNCLLIEPWDSPNYDDQLTQFLILIKYISDQAIHHHHTIPDIIRKISMEQQD
jgi:hypothetical protein